MCEVHSYTELMSNGLILTLVLGLVTSKFPWAWAQGKWAYSLDSYEHNMFGLEDQIKTLKKELRKKLFRILF